MKNKLFILIGTPTSGKSSYIKTLNLDNTYIASTDNIITSLHPNKSYNEAFEIESPNFKKLDKLMMDNIKLSISENKDIIVDRTNMKKSSRAEYLRLCKDYEKIAIVFLIDENTFLKRNEERFIKEGKKIPLNVWRSMYNNYEEPTKEEGFDQILFL